jgi:hypothetical protein
MVTSVADPDESKIKVAFKSYLWKKVNILVHILLSMHNTLSTKKVKICQF